MEREVRERFERIESIIERGTKESVARFNRLEESIARNQEESKANVVRFEKRMRGFEKLAQIGFRRIAHIERLNREADEKINALIQAQLRSDESIKELHESTKQTQAMFRQFLKSFGKGRNGH